MTEFRIEIFDFIYFETMELLHSKYTLILILTFQISVCHGAISDTEHEDTRRDPSETTQVNDSVKLLLKVMRSISDHTQRPLTILDGLNIDVLYRMLDELVNSSSCDRGDGTVETRTMTCNFDSGNVLTVKAGTGISTYLSLAVHNGSMVLANPLRSIETFCYKHFTTTQKTTTCPTTTTRTCPPCTTTCHTTTKQRCPSPILTISCNTCIGRCYTTSPEKVCTECDNICPNLVTREDTTTYPTTTNDNKGTYDASKEYCNQSTGISIIAIVIASIASFIAGIVVCLFVLCLLRHCRERLCLKSTTPDAGSSKSNKEPYEGLHIQSQMKPIPEYLDLQTVSSECHTEIDLKRPQQSGPKQSPMYEMSDKRRSDHVYSELGNTQTNASNVYESTFQNRSSDHVYQGIQSNTNPDIPTKLQTHRCTENGRKDETHTIDTMEPGRMNAKPMSETDSCYTQNNDYFVLEKGSNSVNKRGMGDGTKAMKHGDVNANRQSEPDDCYTEHGNYFVLEKENHATNEPGMGVDTMSNEPGDLNTDLQSEPDGCNTQHTDYFVLEKENHAIY